MGFEGVGVFSIKSDLDPLLYIPMFKGGTTTADDDLGFFDDAADWGRGIATLPEFFGVSFDCFELDTFLLLSYLSLLLVLLLELFEEGGLDSSFAILPTDDIFDWSSFNVEWDDLTDDREDFFFPAFGVSPCLLFLP